ncbi:hypothetical protein [Catenulispora pinisilvae]|uniref:hypothetical protein n=1 Tax=Catenulispora pinisilvae TaxID=2705253 RepID=UPI003F6A1210
MGEGSLAGCWLLVAGCWLLVAGCWLLVAGCWLLVCGLWFVVCGLWFVVAGLRDCGITGSLGCNRALLLRRDLLRPSADG